MYERLRRPAFASLLVAGLAAGTDVEAAQSAFLEVFVNGTLVEGEPTLGAIGGIDVSRHIEAISAGFSVTTPRDSTGQIRGRREYRPFTIRKRVNKSSPVLFNALVTGASVDVVARFFENDDTGATVHSFTIELGDGRIVDIAPALADTLNPDTAPRPFTEVVSFVFQTITLTSETGATEAFDSLGTSN